MLTRYAKVEDKYILDAYNLGYLKPLDNLSVDISVLNSWISRQRCYIQSLTLEEKSAIILYLKHSELFDPSLKYAETIQKVISSKFHQLHPDEDLPSEQQLIRYYSLLYKVVKASPILPFNLTVYSNNNNSIVKYYTFNNDNESNIVSLNNNHRCLYTGSVYTGDILTIASNYNYIPIQPLLDDIIFLTNATKETWEESGIDISKIGKIHSYIDFPLYKQKSFKDSNNQEYYKVARAHGTSASGTTIICTDDNTILCFLRNGEDFDQTWCGVGGSIGEDSTKVYNSKFVYRSYIVHISNKDKELINKSIKLNHENSIAHWYAYSELSKQLGLINMVRSDNTGSDTINKYLLDDLPNPIFYDQYKEVFLSSVNKGKKFIYLQHPIHKDKYFLAIPSLTYIFDKL